MATRLFLISLIVAAVCCRGTNNGGESKMTGSGQASADSGRDAIERALLSLPIDGRTYRYDLNMAKLESGPIRLAKVHLMRGLVLLEDDGENKAGKPRVFALTRGGLDFRWQSRLQEPTKFRAAENGDSVLLLSAHFLHALDKDGGTGTIVPRRLGAHRNWRSLPFTPTGGPAAQSDTVYIPSLGTHDSNKNLETLSLIDGARGWGSRTSSDIFTSVVVGGSSGDPKLYFVTRSGHLTCMDAETAGYVPAGARWEELLDAGVTHDFFLTRDREGTVGAVYIVDNEGVVYCIDRITGGRRWTNATGRVPAGGPQVFGNLCVVKMESGLTAFHAGNVVYRIDGADGQPIDYVAGDYTPDRGIHGLKFEVTNEVLHVTGKDDAKFTVNGAAATNHATVRKGDVIGVGGTSLRVHDRGTEPVWEDLAYDRIVARMGMILIAQTGDTLQPISLWTGEKAGDAVNIAGARIVPANTSDGNLFVVAGDAVVYALFTR